MRCPKSFGERIASRDPDRQTAEIHIRIALMTRFHALGTAEIEHVACSHRGKGTLAQRGTSATMPRGVKKKLSELTICSASI